MTTPLLCATVAATTMADLRARRDAARDADLVELRLDGVRDLDLDGALAGRPGPVIVTCRPSWEGGQFDGSEEERHQILERALALGAEWVDLEWQGGFESVVAARGGRNVVLSSHDFDDTPADLEERFGAMRATGAAVVKLAVTTRSGGALRRLQRLGSQAADTRQVLVGMGQLGVPSRLLPARFGSAWTYAGDGVAPGQVSLADMLDRYRFRRLTPTTPVYGVAGVPIGHSLSPSMHNAGLAALGIDAVYIPFEATDAGDLFALADALGVRGLSITAPFKEAVLSHLTDIDALGRQVGAVNTLRREEAGWVGRNTDVPGFLAPLDARGAFSGTRATVLGAGGAARGVVVALASRGAKVTVCARRPDRAATVAALAGGKTGAASPEPGTWDLLVNTTPTGTAPRHTESPVPAGALRGGGTVYDLVYNPRQTRLLEEAARAGCETIGGLDMLVAQAHHQFAWWFGADPPAGLFHDVASATLRQQPVVKPWGEEHPA